jgi:regulator of sigma D
LQTIEEKEELKKLIYDKMLYKSEIIEVRWPMKKNSLLQQFRLVDTPGLVQNLVGEMKVSVQEYYHKADGVIWLLDATKISAQKSREMMDELNMSLEQVGGRTDNIIAVLNSVDKVRKIGGEEAVAAVTAEAKRLFGDLFQEIIPISAKEALDGILAGDKELIVRSGIIQLHHVIQSHFFSKAQMIQTESKIVGLKSVCHQFGKESAQYQSRVGRDLRAFDKRSEDFDTAYNELIKKIEKGNGQFLNKYRSKVIDNIENRTERLFDFNSESQQKSYLESSIFEMSSLTAELKQLQANYAEMIKEFYKYYAPKAIFKEYEHLSLGQLPATLQDDAAIKLETGNVDFDTSGLSVLSGAGMFLAGALVLGPLGLVLAGIASALGLAKWIAVKMKLSGLKSDLRSALYELVGKLEDEILEVVNPQLTNVYDSIEEIRSDTYASLHGNRDETERLVEQLEELQKQMASPIQELKLKDVMNDLLRKGQPA